MAYSPAESVATPSYSRKDPGRIARLRKKHGNVFSPGNGWAYFYETSRLMLLLGNDKEVDVAPFFKERWGKLTTGRREAIEETMPADVKAINGTVDKDILGSWLERAKKANTLLARKARKKKKLAEAVAQEKKDERWFAALERREAKERKEKIASAPKYAFVVGWNNKHQHEQWKHRSEDGVLHVLCQEDEYDASEGAVPVEVMRELVPEKIFLVRRIDRD